MDIRDRVMTSGTEGEERGLLSVALHPRYNQTSVGRVFSYYIRNVSGQDYTYVSEFTATDDVVDVTSERFLLRVRQPFVKGNGGQLLFGDDGLLYIFTGDGTGNDDLQGNAQDSQSFLGKVLRVDVDQQGLEAGDSSSARLYHIPPSNPFIGNPHARPEVFALGLRNPWRCSLDSKNRGGTGRIFCGDTGTDMFEEINNVQKGRNYGWNLKEGTYCFNSLNCTKIENEAKPIYTYAYSPDWGSAVVAGYVYRGSHFSQLQGSLLYGDVVTGHTYLLRESGGNWTSREWSVCPESRCPCQARHDKSAFLLAFGQRDDGELMLLMASEFSVLKPRGTLFQVVPPIGTAQKPVTCAVATLSPLPVVSLLLLHVLYRLCGLVM
ncbi:hypothetical protein BaRGS_00004602 [Batillaria attramentaria]|uniref:Glucose/Sorbosone dehydrogenase domain-containing protein n=1 Tax=Batillaria attramentaria TaxID=370345 RepID=A0ABD0LYU8_9CAEN